MEHHLRGRRGPFRRLRSSPTHQSLPCARNCEAFLIQHPFDLENGLDIGAYVNPLTAPTLFGLEEGEFSFPVSQDIRLESSDATHLTDLIK